MAARRPSALRPLLKKLLSRLLLILVGIISGLIALEAGIRLFFPPIPERIFAASTEVVWQHVHDKDVHYASSDYDNVVHLNHYGLVDTDFPLEKAPGVFRILVLGDSYAEALQVPQAQTYHGLLEAKLNALNDGQKYEVINAGVSAYGTDQELLYYQLEGRKFAPDLVLLLMSRNDVQDNLNHGIFQVENGELTRVPNSSLFDPTRLRVIEPIREFLYDHSQAYRYSLLFQRVVMDDTFFAPTYLYMEPLSPAMTLGWQLTDALVAKLDSEVQADGARFAICYVPERVQMGGSEWDTMTTQARAEAVTWNINATNEHVGQLAQSLAIPFTDPTDSFRAALSESDEPLFFKIDIHWTERGHQLIANQLLTFLDTAKLLP